VYLFLALVCASALAIHYLYICGGSIGIRALWILDESQNQPSASSKKKSRTNSEARRSFIVEHHPSWCLEAGG